MRLIDADALKKTLKAVLMQSIFSDADDEEKQAIKIGEKVVRELVDLLPTIDAVPVVHARWEESEYRDEKYRCSACGGACWYYDYQGAVARSRFCPNCGARMDEKEDGE